MGAAVRRHTFLGANTRLELELPLGVLLADVPSTEAAAVPLGSRGPAAPSRRFGGPRPSPRPESRQPAVVAHRGASAHHPEKHLRLFEAAVAADVDIVEFDVEVECRRRARRDPRPDGAHAGPDPAASAGDADSRRGARTASRPRRARGGGQERARGRADLRAGRFLGSCARWSRPCGDRLTDSFISSFDDETLALRLQLDEGIRPGLLVEPPATSRGAPALDRPAHVLAPRRDLARECRSSLIDRAHELGGTDLRLDGRRPHGDGAGSSSSASMP